MKNLPVKEELDRIISGNYKVKHQPYYVKIFSELYHREYNFSLGFRKNGLEEAVYVAGRYQKLAKAGFYPEKSRFIITRDSVGIITIASIMPEMIEIEPEDQKIKEMRQKAAETLGIKVEELSNDTTKKENYGTLDGRIYCFDSHVMPFENITKHGLKYRYTSIA